MARLEDEDRAESPATIREWDRRTIEELGLPGIALMEDAGSGAARVVRELHAVAPQAYPQPFVVLCGPGNNGGDGYVVARHLDVAGLAVEVWLAFDRARLDPASDAGVNLAVLERAGIPVHYTPAPHTAPADLDLARPCTVVDALLGTGLSRALREPYLSWVRAAAASGRAVVALDVPTGLDADSGEVLGAVLPARHTVTFGAAKRGFFREEGPRTTGKVHVVALGIPRCVRAPRAPPAPPASAR
jgi:NAD(P)H-hydrate epimerase